MSFIVNLRVETMKIPEPLGFGCFTNVFFYSLLKVLWRENKTTKAIKIANTLRPMCLAWVLEKALSSSPGVMCMLSHLGVGTQTTNRQNQGAPGRRFAVNDCAGCFVSEFVSCCSSSVSKGPRQPGELSEPQELMSFWLSTLAPCKLFNIILDRAVRKKCAEWMSLTPVGPEPDCSGGLWACSYWNEGSILAFRWWLSFS